MAILVDQPLWTFRGEKWSHLVSDESYDELHIFANGVGIRRIGFQGDHYDLPSRLLPAALAAGAAQVDSRILVRRLRNAGLRKPADYESWNPLLRHGAAETDEIHRLVEAELSAITPTPTELLNTCTALWTAIDNNGGSVHQLFVLQRPNQLAVAFDTDLAMEIHVAAAELASTAELWITNGNPLLAVDVLIDMPPR